MRRDQADRCLEIHRQFPQRKGIFDPANYVQCGDDTVRGWDLLKDYIHYLHIKDALSNGVVVPAGKGEGNMATSQRKENVTMVIADTEATYGGAPTGEDKKAGTPIGDRKQLQIALPTGQCH